jgi:hypothetical protein
MAGSTSSSSLRAHGAVVSLVSGDESCCECEKKIDLTVQEVPPKWFGKWEGDKQVSVICSDCIKEPKKLKKWQDK